VKNKAICYKIFKFILGPIYKFWYNPKIEGKENIPKDGRFIIVGNHVHSMDQCNVVISTKRTLFYMAKKEYFDDKKVAWFFKSTGCISVNRQIHDDKAKELAMNVLYDGDALGLFPEGTRNKTDKFLLPFKFGAVSMAKKTDAYLIPFAVTGDYKFRSKNLVYRFGKPFKVTNMNLSEANNRLHNAISNLMAKNYREEKSINVSKELLRN
jgi:1-acyl-sn-glycerol-3-phosphate acyltransferase